MKANINFDIFLFGLALIINVQNSFVNANILNSYTEKEKEAIEKFRILVGDYLTQDFMKTDSYLLRWIKAAKFNLEKAVDSMKKLHEWRQNNNIDNILNEDLRVHRRYMPTKLDGFDRDGVPVLQVYLGKWELRKYALAGKRDQVLRYCYQIFEKINHKVYETEIKAGKEVSQLYLIEDLGGFSINQACLQCVPIILEVTRAFVTSQPYLIKKAVLVNVPRIFFPILAGIKSLLPQYTADAIETNGHNRDEWVPRVLKDIAPDQIPPAFGGTKVDE